MNGIDVEQLLGDLERDRRDRGGISTTSLNVIAFIENDEPLLHWLAESSDEFAEAHGFRIVLLDASSAPDTHSVRTHCKECDDTLLTSLEQIQLGVKSVGATQLRSVVHDLMHPSIRNVLLWGGQSLEDERFEALSNLADRIILFSARRDPAIESLRQLARLHDSEIAGRLRDLAYMRLLAWQDTTAQFFDEPDLADELPKITRVEIASGSEPEAYYLAAWLASRLGWDPCGELNFCNAAGESIRVEFHKEGMPRRMRSIRLHSPACTFGIAVSPDADDLLCLTVEGDKARALRCVPLHDVDIISLVQRAIFSPDDGGVYLQTLGLLERLFEWDAHV